MSDEKIYLNIPPAHLAYAKQFGIEKDEKGKYFVRGELGPELHSYRIKEARRRDCSTFPHCKGMKPFE